MSDDGRDDEDFDEDGPGVNGDAASWFYVLGGIPAMILFFALMFGLVGSCDGSGLMLPG